MKNRYACKDCGKDIITEGGNIKTTPAIIKCVHGCGGTMGSDLYRLPPVVAKVRRANYRWITPEDVADTYSKEYLSFLGYSDAEIKIMMQDRAAYIQIMKTHCDRGGLILIKNDSATNFN